MRRAPAFLTYYVFSAGIMHMTTLSVRPGDVQAAMGLQLCMDALQTMSVCLFPYSFLEILCLSCFVDLVAECRTRLGTASWRKD